MRSRLRAVVTLTVVSVSIAATGCTRSTPPPAATTSIVSTAPTTRTPPPAATTSAAPTGAPVGTAVMKVTGGSAPVTIRYRINAGPEQTQTTVALPWEKQYSVYNELESQVTADGGDVPLTCTIIMDGR